MKVLIYVGDLVTDMPGIYMGGQIARHFHGEVTLLHVAPKKKKKKQERKDGETILNRAKKELPDVLVSTRVRRGDVGDRILAELREQEYQMVVITASRIGGYPRHLSVRREILSQIPCCLVIAKNPKPEVKSILLLTGGQPISEAVVEVGARFASALDAQVTLMHVTANVPTMYTGLDTIEETLHELLQTETPVAKHLRRCAQILNEYHVTATIKLRHGEAVFEILREIDLVDYDFVVLGATGVAKGIKEWFLGDVTRGVIDMVGIPVMVVHQLSAEKIKKIF